MQGQTIKTDSPVEGSTDTIDTVRVRCFTNETGIHEYNPNLSNSVLQTVRGLPLEKWYGWYWYQDKFTSISVFSSPSGSEKNQYTNSVNDRSTPTHCWPSISSAVCYTGLCLEDSHIQTNTWKYIRVITVCHQQLRLWTWRWIFIWLQNFTLLISKIPWFLVLWNIIHTLVSYTYTYCNIQW